LGLTNISEPYKSGDFDSKKAPIPPPTIPAMAKATILFLRNNKTTIKA
jgi:hypothetical protein